MLTFLIATGLDLDNDFESVKSKLMTHAGFNEERYILLFHQLTPTNDDMINFAVNVAASLKAWIRQSNTKETCW